MLARPLLSQVLHNEAVTRGLGDPEARILVEWLVDRAEQLAESLLDEAAAQRRLNVLCRRARAFRHFVELWCYQRRAAPPASSPPPNASAGRCPAPRSIRVN